ncbi:family 43 glycosylhydrolase [Chloroflexia bacterium SDU3-3]|nr:family 43 glycosylhydrolase [Chloroflexia bacterium SDU3-3]
MLDTISRRAMLCLFTALLLVGSALPSAASASTGDYAAHDPTMIKAGSYYYVFSTGDNAYNKGNIQIRRSADLNSWARIGTVFSSVPAWITTALGTTPGNLWAPDINYINGTYYLYYAGSTFGTNSSVIGLATATNIEGPWTDQGQVLKSTSSNNYNAIDPEVAWTITNNARAEQWLVFGSFWDGIKMRRLDAATGKLSTSNTTLYSLASRGGGAIEAASIAWRNGYYYLFVSFDTCCQGTSSTYRTMVGRSTSITGPYVDQAGTSMLNGGGTQILASSSPYIGQGGGDVVLDGSTYRFAHHYYDANDGGAPKLAVRNLTWTSDGWPIAGPVLPDTQGSGSTFTLVNRNSSKVLDVANCGTADGANVQQWASLGNTCQRWKLGDAGSGYYTLTNVNSGKVLEAAGCGTADGVNVQQWTSLGNTCQQWQVLVTSANYVRLVNRNSGKVLDVANCSTADGANVQQWASLGNNCQQWYLKP